MTVKKYKWKSQITRNNVILILRSSVTKWKIVVLRHIPGFMNKRLRICTPE